MTMDFKGEKSGMGRIAEAIKDIAKALRHNHEKTLTEILTTVKCMAEKQEVFMATVKEQLDAVAASLDKAGTALENIAADEAAQTKLILELQAIISGGGVITAEQLQPLVDKSKAVADAAQAAADAIPDVPTP